MELVKSLKSSKIIKYAFIALIGSIALAISSKVKIPFYPVPMTMQTLVVIMIGAAFGWKLGLATVSLYLFEGIIGLPVFSGTPEKGIGLVYFIGPTMGYLTGFLVAAFLAGKFNYNKNLLFGYVSTDLKIEDLASKKIEVEIEKIKYKASILLKPLKDPKIKLN